ncbi:MAG: alpha/beta fold hydrolase [Candidatus Omnitrophica bacterium]|nr:alpha/beta fold hydrolase [Candidatus Omnitrophota bacterium]MBU1933279.1 alpha/beta fold hydrolase [Candidatus Omnitrophota bacterium]
MILHLLIASSLIVVFKAGIGFSETEQNKSHLKSFLIQNANPQKKLDMLIKKYHLDDEKTGYAIETLEEIKSRLGGIRAYILTKNKCVYLVPTLDMFMTHIGYKINVARNSTQGVASLLSPNGLKGQILKSNQLFSVDSIKDSRGITRNADKLREKIFYLIDHEEGKSKPQAQIIKRIDCTDYSIDKIALTGKGRSALAGYLMIPKNISFPAPAILALHQHSGEYYVGAAGIVGLAECYPTIAYGPTLARRGYIVFAVDARGFGSNIMEDESVEDYLSRWLGKSLFAMIIDDDLTALDYLVKRKEVDPRRIGAIGHSMGGARVTYLAAIDKRIRAAVISGYLTSYKEMIKRDIVYQSPSTWLPGILSYADCKDVLSLIAPRPLLTVHGKGDDVFPFEEALKVYDSIKRIYGLFKAGDKLQSVFFDGSHDLPAEALEEACNFFDKWLKKR